MFIKTASGVQVQANPYWNTADHAPPPAYDPNAAHLYPAASPAATQPYAAGDYRTAGTHCTGTDVSKALATQQHGSVAVPYPVAPTNVVDKDGSLVPSLASGNLNGSANPITRFNGLNNVNASQETGHQLSIILQGNMIRGLVR
jgi:hypothetical protein